MILVTYFSLKKTPDIKVLQTIPFLNVTHGIRAKINFSGSDSEELSCRGINVAPSLLNAILQRDDEHHLVQS